MFKYNLIKDIERCPYMTREPEYQEWSRADNERLKKISDARENVILSANEYLSHPDRGVRMMALFITEMFVGYY